METTCPPTWGVQWERRGPHEAGGAGLILSGGGTISSSRNRLDLAELLVASRSIPPVLLMRMQHLLCECRVHPDTSVGAMGVREASPGGYHSRPAVVIYCCIEVRGRTAVVLCVTVFFPRCCYMRSSEKHPPCTAHFRHGWAYRL